MSRRIFLMAFPVAASLLLVSCGGPPSPRPDVRRVLCSTFPVHLIARNVVQGREGLALDLMLPAQLGCPHDYALTPDDLRRLAQADALIVNGLGLEEFLGAPVRKANPSLALIDSSAGIADLLHEAHEGPVAHRAHEGPCAHGVNPHLFASPRQAARMAVTIAEGLAKFDPAGAELYRRNANAYAERLNRLADELRELGNRLKNRRIATPHGVFDYLARDMGLEVVAHLQAHAGQEPSAAEMIGLVRILRDRQAGAVFTEPQYPPRTARTIAREAGIAAATLDPVATGPQNASLDYYEKIMRENRKTLESVLGTK